MAGRRHTVNPAKVKAEYSALEANPPPEVFQRRLELRRRLSVVLLNLLTVAMLSVSFAPFNAWYFAYVAMVPWTLSLAGGSQKRWPVLWGWLAGVLFWAINLYWLAWITPLGYGALALYLSAYWFVAAWVVRRALQRNWPVWLVLPLVWVATEYARSWVISGFPWFMLAHSQYAQTRLIQIADVTGQYGVSFFVALVNGVIVDVLADPLFVRTRRGPRLAARIIGGVAAGVVCLAFLLGYGSWRLSQNTQSLGPVLGIVQQAYPISLNEPSTASPEEVVKAHIDASQAFRDAGCDLVVWPETMLPKGVNSEFLTLEVDRYDYQQRAFLAERFMRPEDVRQYSATAVVDAMISLAKKDAEKVAAASVRLKCPILAGAPTIHYNASPAYPSDVWVVRNSALWFDGSWRSSGGYSKTHLVPFSEYVPFKHSWLGLHNVLRSFVPAVMEQLDPGTDFPRFTLVRGGGKWTLATPICYEGTFPDVCRDLTMQDGKKTTDILVNMSNDGWFVWPWGRRTGSTEHPQHLVQYCFRAIENRVPVVRAVNTGISASIDSNGRLLTVLERNGVKTMIAGTLLLDGARRNETEYQPGHGPQLLVDRRVSLYSLIGDVFAIAVSAAAVGMVLALAWRRRRDEHERQAQ